MSERASIFENSADFDLKGFTPKDGKPKRETPPEAVRAVAETAQFHSREPAPPAKKKPAQKEPRRYVTGRNVQLSVKVSSETRDAFYAIADSQKWVLGVALERAIAALERELAGG
jgi:hypothetical protein